MRAITMLASVFVLAGVGSGCDSPTEPETIFGLYQLQTVGDLPMPYVLMEDETGKLEIVSGSLNLYDEVRFRTDWTTRLTIGQASDTSHDINVGTFEQNGSALTVTFPGGTTFPGTINDKTVTIIDQVVTFVYVKP